MTRKRYTPEGLLAQVVRHLESRAPRDHVAAVVALLASGPLHCGAALRYVKHLHARPDDRAAITAEVSLWRAEMLAFLRNLVGRQTSFGPLALSDGIAFMASQSTGRVGVELELPVSATRDRLVSHVRDQVMLQLILLLRDVGIAALRVCPAEAPRRHTARPREEWVWVVPPRDPSGAAPAPLVGVRQPYQLMPIPRCDRLFVKTYRREFCSVRCQKRTAVQRMRRKDQEQLMTQQRTNRKRTRKREIDRG